MSNSICNKFEERVQDLVESKTEVLSRDLLAHAEGCEQCRTLWEDLHGLDQTINLWKKEVVQADFTERVLAGLENDRPMIERSQQGSSSSRNRRIMRYSTAACVVALLLVLVISPLFQFGNRNEGTGELNTDLVTTEPSGEISGDLAEVIWQVRNSSLQFVVDAGNSASDATMFIPEREEWPSLGQTFASLPAKERSVSNQLVEGFSPLGNRLDRAFHDLLGSVDRQTEAKPELK